NNSAPEFGVYLPPLIVAYTSGDNETLSLPFYFSRSGYASSVTSAARTNAKKVVPNNRLVMLDYSTHLEVLVSNVTLGSDKLRHELVKHANLS
ncbi:hypothetical protein, partial [Psychrobacter sp. TB20-MNA-CIBAN-0197]